MGTMIIRTKKMTPKEVKSKLHDFIDELTENCGPEIEEMSEELKAHGDEFIDALTGNASSASYRGNYRGGSGGYRGNMGGGSYRGSSVNMGNGSSGSYREESEQLPMRRGGGFRDSDLDSAYREGYEKAKMERELIDDEAMRRNSRFGR